MLLPIALVALLRSCAPSVGPLTMGALVMYESGAHPNAIDDDTTHRSYQPASRGAALQLARQLLDHGHTIDVGYAQVDSANFSAYGLTIARAFDPCTNLATAARILSADYVRAVSEYGPGQTALEHALSTYNSGNPRTGTPYSAAVYATAARMAAQP